MIFLELRAVFKVIDSAWNNRHPHRCKLFVQVLCLLLRCVLGSQRRLFFVTLLVVVSLFCEYLYILVYFLIFCIILSVYFVALLYISFCFFYFNYLLFFMFRRSSSCKFLFTKIRSKLTFSKLQCQVSPKRFEIFFIFMSSFVILP